MFVCTSASRLPSDIVSTAMAASRPVQYGAASAGHTMANTRTSSAKLAALLAVLTKAVTEGGAPSYTYGDQKWNGTAEILKPKPTSMNSSAIIRPNMHSALPPISAPSGSALSYLLAGPANTNSRHKPYRNTPADAAPNRKYLMPASVL